MTLDEVGAFDQQCQSVMNGVAEMNVPDLEPLILAFAGGGNVYILRGLSSRLADSDAGTDIHLLVFPMLQRLMTQDMNVLTNLMTAIARLHQSGVDWKTPERLELARRLAQRCQGVADMLSEDAQDFEQQYL